MVMYPQWFMLMHDKSLAGHHKPNNYRYHSSNDEIKSSKILGAIILSTSLLSLVPNNGWYFVKHQGEFKRIG